MNSKLVWEFHNRLNTIGSLGKIWIFWVLGNIQLEGNEAATGTGKSKRSKDCSCFTKKGLRAIARILTDDGRLNYHLGAQGISVRSVMKPPYTCAKLVDASGRILNT